MENLSKPKKKYRRELKYTSLSRFVNSTRHTTYTHFETDNDIIISHCQCTHSSVSFVCVCVVLFMLRMNKFLLVCVIYSVPVVCLSKRLLSFMLFSPCLLVWVYVCWCVCVCVHSIDSLFLYVSIFIALPLSFTVSLSLNIPSLMQNKKEHFGYFVVLYVFFIFSCSLCEFFSHHHLCMFGGGGAEGKGTERRPNPSLYIYTTLL